MNPTPRQERWERHTEAPFNHSPYAYARHLARYIRDASTIRARTLDTFGRSPPRDIIADMIADARKPEPEPKGWFQGCDGWQDDGSDWKPRGLVQAERIAARPRLVLIEPDAPYNEPPRPIVTAFDIIDAIARCFDMSGADMTGKGRFRHIVRARNCAAYVLHKRGNSFPRIGKFLGGRDHSTVIHAVRQFEAHATAEEREIAARFLKPVEVA